MVKFSRDLMHRGTGDFATCVNGTLVRLQTRKGWQQRGMDVEQATGKAAHKPGRQDAHKARQHHERRVGRVVIHRNLLRQGGIKRLTVRISGVVQRMGHNALRFGPGQTGRLGIVADHGGHARAMLPCPVVTL